MNRSPKTRTEYKKRRCTGWASKIPLLSSQSEARVHWESVASSPLKHILSGLYRESVAKARLSTFQTADFWVYRRLSALSQYLACSNTSGTRRSRASFKTSLCDICLLPDGKSRPPSHQRVRRDPRSDYEAHILLLLPKMKKKDFLT